jgi:hypothetical protein
MVPNPVDHRAYSWEIDDQECTICNSPAGSGSFIGLCDDCDEYDAFWYTNIKVFWHVKAKSGGVSHTDYFYSLMIPLGRP